MFKRSHATVGRGGVSNESGFALLFVYAMAATVAITLYMELPRVAFEAQRDKEQLLIDRGEQYTRAVTLYVRKFNRFPADFDALQNTQNLRFLRHKYVDPMTGKDEWRIIHVGPGGVFTDSLVYGKKKDPNQQTEQQNFITELAPTGGNPAAANQNVNIAARQRQSDLPGAPGDVNNPSQSAPVIQPDLPQFGQTQPVLPQFDANGQQIPNAPTAPGQQGNQPGAFPQNQFPGFPGVPGQQPVQPFGQQPVQQFGQQPVQQFGQQPGQQPSNAPPSAAANLINQILTTPRPGGLNGLGGAQRATVDQFGNPVPNQNGFGTNSASISTLSAPTPTPAPAQVIGGGIAGVASKLEEDAIKVYKEQTSYNKWEFVYDITKDPARGGGTVPQAAPAPGTAPGQTAAPASNPPPTATPALGLNSPSTQMPVTPQ